MQPQDRQTDVVFRLATANDCTSTSTLCSSDGQPLLKTLTATVAGAIEAPSVAGVAQVGATLEASFAQAPGGSLVANAAAIVSQASGIAADLRHDGTEPIAAQQQGEADPLTAEFLDLPAGGHGANPFTIKLRFSEEFPLSYKTLQNHALGVTNGTLTGVARGDARGGPGVERHGDAGGRRRGDGRAGGDDGLRGDRRDLHGRRTHAGGGLGDGAGDGTGAAADAVQGERRLARGA